MKKYHRAVSFIEQTRRKQIIEATIACAAEDGYSGVSIAKVAQSAKISKSVVLYYFDGKDELLTATAQMILDELGRFILPKLEAQESARGQLRAYIQAEFSFLELHRSRLLAISSILANHRNSRGELQLQKEAEKVNLRVWSEILQRGQANGEFRPFAIKPMAVMLMNAINGALAQWVAEPSTSLSSYADELVTIFDLATRNGGRQATTGA